MGCVLNIRKFQTLSNEDLIEINGGLANFAWLVIGAVAEYACQELFDKSLGEIVVEAVKTVASLSEMADDLYYETFYGD